MHSFRLPLHVAFTHTHTRTHARTHARTHTHVVFCVYSQTVLTLEHTLHLGFQMILDPIIKSIEQYFAMLLALLVKVLISLSPLRMCTVYRPVNQRLTQQYIQACTHADIRVLYLQHPYIYARTHPRTHTFYAYIHAYIRTYMLHTHQQSLFTALGTSKHTQRIEDKCFLSIFLGL